METTNILLAQAAVSRSMTVPAPCKELRSRFLSKSGTRLVSIPADHVAYFYTRERVQFIKTMNNQEFIIDKRLELIEAVIDPQLFFRVNRQFIIKYNCIEKVYTCFGGKLKVQVSPAAHEEIFISRLKAAEFRKWLGE